MPSLKDLHLPDGINVCENIILIYGQLCVDAYHREYH